jgi:NADP-dependent 3-hydroxy acid dehydrogenase YdfG
VNSPDHGRVDHGLAGRAVIVTGGTRGIGLGIATALTRAGALVTITGRSSKRLEAARVALSSLGTEPLALQRNVADRSAMLDVAALTFERFGRIDGLVNNAQSFRPVMPLADVEESDINLLFDTGPKGTLWGMQAVLPFMRAAGWGRIVNMGSSAGIRGDAGYGPYAASKEAIRALTRVAALAGRALRRHVPRPPDGPRRRCRSRHCAGRAVSSVGGIALPQWRDADGRRRRPHARLAVSLIFLSDRRCKMEADRDDDF